jgi:hypothetical protein
MKLNVDDHVINFIATTLDMEESSIRYIYNFYKMNIDDLMEEQYLAHSIRSVEQFVFNRKGTWIPIRSLMLVRGVPAYVQYPTHFLIYCPKSYKADTAASKKIRMAFAHELGHLIFNTNEKDDRHNRHEIKPEDMANVLGLFILLGRSALYREKRDAFADLSQEDIATEYRDFISHVSR